MGKSRRSGSSQGAANTVRIIGGRWRRRKLQFPPIEGLRPTPDRIRETVFNWLAPHIKGATVLDAYCGSGALGLESLSRDARQCVFVDSSAMVKRHLQQNLTTLECGDATLVQGQFLNWLATCQQSFNIVFLDPPYSSGLLQPSIDAIASLGCLSSNALVYFEHPVAENPTLPSDWLSLKDLKAGRNHYRLAQRVLSAD
ncbi:MAG: 16S rRNA (guanine(966)-N(2))-methyltransferase RsmD [Pseudomonadales bacterium]